MAFENYVIPVELGRPSYPKLNLHLFRAILQERIEGNKTAIECLNALQAQLGVTLTGADITDLQAVMSLINAESTIPEKMAVAEQVYRVFIIAESGCSWYNSRALIKARLGFI